MENVIMENVIMAKVLWKMKLSRHDNSIKNVKTLFPFKVGRTGRY